MLSSQKKVIIQCMKKINYKFKTLKNRIMSALIEQIKQYIDKLENGKTYTIVEFYHQFSPDVMGLNIQSNQITFEVSEKKIIINCK